MISIVSKINRVTPSARAAGRSMLASPRVSQLADDAIGLQTAASKQRYPSGPSGIGRQFSSRAAASAKAPGDGTAPDTHIDIVFNEIFRQLASQTAEERLPLVERLAGDVARAACAPTPAAAALMPAYVRVLGRLHALTMPGSRNKGLSQGSVYWDLSSAFHKAAKLQPAQTYHTLLHEIEQSGPADRAVLIDHAVGILYSHSKSLGEPYPLPPELSHAFHRLQQLSESVPASRLTYTRTVLPELAFYEAPNVYRMSAEELDTAEHAHIAARGSAVVSVVKRLASYRTYMNTITGGAVLNRALALAKTCTPEDRLAVCLHAPNVLHYDERRALLDAGIALRPNVDEATAAALDVKLVNLRDTDGRTTFRQIDKEYIQAIFASKTPPSQAALAAVAARTPVLNEPEQRAFRQAILAHIDESSAERVKIYVHLGTGADLAPADRAAFKQRARAAVNALEPGAFANNWSLRSFIDSYRKALHEAD